MNSFYNIMGGQQQDQTNSPDDFRQKLIQMYLQQMGNAQSGAAQGMASQNPQATGVQSPQQQAVTMGSMPQQTTLPQNAMAMNYLMGLYNRQSPYGANPGYTQGLNNIINPFRQS